MDTPPDDNNRLRVVHETYSLPNTFAIVSTKQLPEVSRLIFVLVIYDKICFNLVLFVQYKITLT